MAEGTGDPVLIIPLDMDLTVAEQKYAAFVQKIGQGLTFGGGGSGTGGSPTFAGGGSGPAGSGAGRSVTDRLLQANERLVRDAEELHQLNERTLQNARTAQARVPAGSIIQRPFDWTSSRAASAGMEWDRPVGRTWGTDPLNAAGDVFANPFVASPVFRDDPRRAAMLARQGAQHSYGADPNATGSYTGPSVSYDSIGGPREIRGRYTVPSVASEANLPSTIDYATARTSRSNVPARAYEDAAPDDFQMNSGGTGAGVATSYAGGSRVRRGPFTASPDVSDSSLGSRNLTYFQRFLAIEGIKSAVDIASAFRQDNIGQALSMGDPAQQAQLALKFREDIAANVPFGIGRLATLIADWTGQDALGISLPLAEATAQDQYTGGMGQRGAFRFGLRQSAQVASAPIGDPRARETIETEYQKRVNDINTVAQSQGNDATGRARSARNRILSDRGLDTSLTDAEIQGRMEEARSQHQEGTMNTYAHVLRDLSGVNAELGASSGKTESAQLADITAAGVERDKRLADIAVTETARAVGYFAQTNIFETEAGQTLPGQGPSALSRRAAEFRQREAEARGLRSIGERETAAVAALMATQPGDVPMLRAQYAAESHAYSATTTAAQRIRSAELNRFEAVAQAQAFGQMQVAAAVASRDPQVIAEAQARAQYAVTVAGARGSDQQALVMQAAAEVRDTAISQSRIQQQSTLAQITGSAAISGRVAARDPYGVIQETGAAETAQLAFGDPSTFNARKDEQAQRQRVRSQQYGDYLALTGTGLNRRETVAALLAQAAGTGAELYATRAGVASTVGLASEAAMRQSQAGQTGFAQQELNVGVSTLGAQRAQFIQGLDVGEDNINRVNLSPEGGATIKDVLDSIDEGIAQLNEQLVRLTD